MTFHETTSTNAISVQGLTKRFSEIQAVSNLTFDTRKGELFGFLGPNGAGKTTTINMLTGLARPDTGQINFLSVKPAPYSSERSNKAVFVCLLP